MLLPWLRIDYLRNDLFGTAGKSRAPLFYQVDEIMHPVKVQQDGLWYSGHQMSTLKKERMIKPMTKLRAAMLRLRPLISTKRGRKGTSRATEM